MRRSSATGSTWHFTARSCNRQHARGIKWERPGCAGTGPLAVARECAWDEEPAATLGNASGGQITARARPSSSLIERASVPKFLGFSPACRAIGPARPALATASAVFSELSENTYLG